MKVTPSKLVDFACDLSSLVLDDYKNTHFRYHTLLLIQKYFKIDMLSFVLFEEEPLTDNHYKEALMNNVTIGIPKKVIDEYYDYNDHQDHIRAKTNGHIQKSKSVNDKSVDDFEWGQYPEYFSHKNDEFYQTSVELEYENTIIGVLTFIKPREKGDFLKRDYDGIQKIKKLVTHELVKSLRYENVYLENNALKESIKDFPVAQLILDHDYNVIYHNQEALTYVDALTGGEPLGFKYFFINDLIITNLIDQNVDENIIHYREFTIIVSKRIYSVNLEKPKNQPYYNVYLFKMDLDHHRHFKGNKYFNLLTEREKEIAIHVRKGLSNDEIADALVISPHTVKKHIQRIYRKCKVSNRVQLINLLSQQ